MRSAIMTSTHKISQEVSELELPNGCLENKNFDSVIFGHLWKMAITVPWSVV